MFTFLLGILVGLLFATVVVVAFLGDWILK